MSEVAPRCMHSPAPLRGLAEPRDPLWKVPWQRRRRRNGAVLGLKACRSSHNALLPRNRAALGPRPWGSGLGDTPGLLFPLRGRWEPIARGVCRDGHLAEEDRARGPWAWPVLCLWAGSGGRSRGRAPRRLEAPSPPALPASFRRLIHQGAPAPGAPGAADILLCRILLCWGAGPHSVQSSAAP